MTSEADTASDEIPVAAPAHGRTPQPGIFALGTASHAYLEFDASGTREPLELVAAIAALREPRTTMGGVNLVAGFRPELWRSVAPDDAPDAKGSTTRCSESTAS